MKIFLATPLYPPEIGGPAQYALSLDKELTSFGYNVSVTSFSSVRNLPSIIRHVVYMLKVARKILKCDRVIILDAVSVGFPTSFLCMVLGKEYIVRVGGDFLWETYIERTKELITLPDFYSDSQRLSWKEKVIKKITFFVLKRAEKIVVNTKWFGEIISKVYSVDPDKLHCIDNYFVPTQRKAISSKKIFLASSREIELKNKKMLIDVFNELDPSLELEIKTFDHDRLQDKIKEAYAIIVVSYSEVNPNLILDGLSMGKPFILTKYTGLHDRFKECGIFIDPFDKISIKEAVIKMCDDNIYESFCRNIDMVHYQNTWTDIALEFEKIIK